MCDVLADSQIYAAYSLWENLSEFQMKRIQPTHIKYVLNILDNNKDRNSECIIALLNNLFDKNSGL